MFINLSNYCIYKYNNYNTYKWRIFENNFFLRTISVYFNNN
jgi:hypothetical protein